MVSSTAGTLVSCGVNVICMALAIATAAAPDAWFSISVGVYTVECGLFTCSSAVASVSFPEFECDWMNGVIKGWRGEAVVVAVFSFVAGGLYFGSLMFALMSPSAARGMQTAAFVLMVLNMLLSPVFAASMLLVVEGSWGSHCLGSDAGISQSISDTPGFSMGSGLYLMCVIFALCIFGTILHCVGVANSSSNTINTPQGYQVYNPAVGSYPQPTNTLQYGNDAASPMEKVAVVE